MLKRIKSLTKQSAVYGFGHILSRSVGFLLLPIQTHYLAEGEYGIASLLFSSLAIFNVLFTYGMDAAFLRFFIVEGNRSDRQRIFSTANWMIFFTSIVFSAVLYFFPVPFSKVIFEEAGLTHLVRMASGIVLADSLGLLPFLVLRGEEKPLQFVFLKALNIFVTLGLNILFLAVLKKGLEGVFISNLIASVFTLLTVIPIWIRWLRMKMDFKTVLELLQFGLPYIPAALAMVIMDQISRFFLVRMIGPEATGVFSASYKLGMFMSLVVAAFRFAWHPFFLSTSKQPDAPKIFARVLTYFTFVTGILFLVISGWLNEIMAFRIFHIRLFDEKFVSGSSIVPIVMLSYIAYGFYVNFMIGIHLRKKTHYLPFITGAGALVSVAGNFFLIPLMGIHGAAWAVCLGYISMAFALYWASRSLYPIPYEWMRIGKLMIVFGLIFFLGFRLHSNWLKLGVLVCAPLVLWLLGFFEKQEKSAIRRIVGLAKQE